jgi:hypothetical protein
MDSDSLKYLLSFGHYDIPTRIALGIWPHPPLKFEDLVRFLANILREEKWFPYELKPIIPGQPAGDIGVIERQGEQKFVYHFRRASPYNVTVVSDQGEIIFKSAEEAARHYLKWELYLPGDLDSWKVVE